MLVVKVFIQIRSYFVDMKAGNIGHPEIELKMLEILEKYPGITHTDLCKMLDISRVTGYKYKKLLEKRISVLKDAQESKISQIINNPMSILHSLLKPFLH